MKILVTGGAGYIGSVLTPKLLKLGHNVIVVDKGLYGCSSLLSCTKYKTFGFLKCDVFDIQSYVEHVKTSDIIIPLAGLVGAPLCSNFKTEAFRVHQHAIQKLVEVSDKNTKIIIPTTNSGYGIGEKDVYCTEETPIKPISDYGISKMAGEEIVMSRGNGISLRLATVFGVSQRMRLDLLVNDFTYRAVHDGAITIFQGHFKRNYIHIQDVTNAFIFCIENFEVMKNNIYNLGLNEANLSKIELCLKIKEYIKNFVFIESEIGEDPDKRNHIVSNDKINAAGFTPSFDLDYGIQELIRAYSLIKNNKYSNF